jgi:hypothetical protein
MERQNLRIFLAKFLPNSLLGVSATTKADNSGGWMAYEKNSYGAHNRPVNGRSCMGRR